MSYCIPFSFSRRSPPPLSDLQLNPPQQLWQLATDDDPNYNYAYAMSRAERAITDPLAAVLDDDATELRAELHNVLARLTDTTVDEADIATAQPTDDAASKSAVITESVKSSSVETPHDPLSCPICGPVVRKSEQSAPVQRSGKEEAMEWDAEGMAAQSGGASGGEEVPLLQMSDLVFLIWDYLPLSQVLQFQHICPRWKELLRLRPSSEEEEEKALLEEQKQQEEREKAGDTDLVRRHQREMHHTMNLCEQHTSRAERTAAAPAYPPPVFPLPTARLPPLLADLDSLLGRQLAFDRAVTGRRARDDHLLHDDGGIRDELRHISAQDIAAITLDLEEMDESEDDAAMATEAIRPGRVRQRERRFERPQTKRARFTPTLVRALWERAHDIIYIATSTSAPTTTTVTAASSSSSSSSSSRRPSQSLSDAGTGSSGGTQRMDEDSEMEEKEEKLPEVTPALRRPSAPFSLSSFGAHRSRRAMRASIGNGSQSAVRDIASSSSSTSNDALSYASTDVSFSSSSSSSFSPPSSSFSSSSSSSGSSSPFALDSSSTAADAAPSAWSSRSYLRRLTHAKLALSPFISPSLSPAILASLSSLTSLHLYHFPFVHPVFEAEYEGAEAEAEEVRQLKEEKEAAEKEERRTLLAQQNKERQELSKQMQEEVKELVGNSRIGDADDRAEMREAREAREARDVRRTPPARLVAVLTRHARLLATHNRPLGDSPPLHLLKPLASQLTTLIYSPACLTTRDMEQLQSLTFLTSLSIHCQMSEAGMCSDDQVAPFLASFPSLQSLSLYCEDNGSTFPANFIPHLILLQPTLTSLSLHSSHWKNDHITTLSQLTHLATLTLSFTTTPITPHHFTLLATTLTQLSTLTLHCGTHLSYALPPQLFSLSGLQSLAVFGSVNVHSSAFGRLYELKGLVRLRVSDCFASLNGLVNCVLLCPQLQVLDVRGSAMSWRHREMLRCERPDIKVLETGACWL